MVCQDINYTRFHILLPQLKYDICGHQKRSCMNPELEYSQFRCATHQNTISNKWTNFLGWWYSVSHPLKNEQTTNKLIQYELTTYYCSSVMQFYGKQERAHVDKKVSPWRKRNQESGSSFLNPLGPWNIDQEKLSFHIVIIIIFQKFSLFPFLISLSNNENGRQVGTKLSAWRENFTYSKN